MQNAAVPHQLGLGVGAKVSAFNVTQLTLLNYQAVCYMRAANVHVDVQINK